jgi:SAM-dependent methyltransferase
MIDQFYRAFEEKHRGSREIVKSRLRVYLPFVEPLQSIYESPKAFDLGCGRGEWLEILTQAGFEGMGVDLDDGMLLACRELGLNVVTGDAITALKQLPDKSQVVVSGFHIAEHIQFSDLQVLVKEAFRVLKPAGLLILETPNPENLIVGTVNFYLDPSHQKPIPPQLLSFLSEYYGFAKVKVIRLQENKELWGKTTISLHDVIGGVSPDYAVVSQKNANEILLSNNNEAFANEYGLTLDSLATRFDQQTVQEPQAQSQKANERAASAEIQAKQATERAANAEAQARQANERAAQAQANTDIYSQALKALEYATQAQADVQGRAQQAVERAHQLEIELHQVTNSVSWAMTAPLRWLNNQAKLMRQFGVSARSHAFTKKIGKFTIGRLLVISNQHPTLRRRTLRFLRKLRLYKSVRSFYISIQSEVSPAVEAQPIAKDMQQLTKRARYIYKKLEDSISAHQHSK